ncbi:hypothetical protein VNO78_05617 [Psophocarpus tetragonolobus]|uniref:Uncharacterized protein n=1 Tax=Psophocarpus tetragonolobus TaxID=3891 RepID=A0AAN9XQJ8_PSOTE
MDSISNLPLLEVAGEDDSLLFDVSAATTTDVFSFSPLLPSRSNPPQSEGREGGAGDSENRSSSINENMNKENADWNKLQKLSMEPQQMKRKKKAGGYNLRKSLAWNRAFFTEEGVLNPVELSMISGTATLKNLETVHEEESVGTSIALQEIEENLFMHSLDAVPVKHTKNGLSPKSAALTKASPAPVSLVSVYILCGDDDSLSKLRTLSDFCPINLDTCLLGKEEIKVPSKELKVTRVPGPKSDISASKLTARRGMLTTGSLNRNQNAHPATNLQKHAGVKGQPKIPKTIPSNPKVGLADKCSVTRTLTKQAGKHSAKAPSSHSQLQKSSKPCKPGRSNIPKVQNLETNSVKETRLPHAPGIRLEIVEGRAKNCIEELSLSHLKSELRIQVDNNKHTDGVEGEHNSLCCEKISKQEKVENILEHVNIKCEQQGELHKSENASSVEDVLFPRYETKLLSMSHTQEQLEKQADQPEVLSNGYQSAVFQEPQSMHYHGMQRTSIMKGSISNTVHNSTGLDEDEQIKLLACAVLTSNASLVLQSKHDTPAKDSRPSEEFEEYKSVKTALSNSSFTDFSETVLGEPIQEIPFKNTEQVNGDAANFVTSAGDAPLHLLNGTLSVYCSETTESNLEAVNKQLQGEQLNTSSAGILGEISASKESESHVNICQLVCMKTLSSEGSPQKYIPEINCPAESETKIAKIENCQFAVDNQSGFIQTRPVLEVCEKVIDSKALDDSIEAFEFDRLSEDSMAVSAPACNTEVTNNVSQESRSFHENNIENLQFTYQLCPVVKADFDFSKNELSTNNCCMILDLQLRGEDSSRDDSMHNDVPCNIPGNFGQQSSKITYEMLCEGESLLLSHAPVSQSEFSEVSADFISNTKDSTRTGAEKSSSCLQHTLAQLVPEVDHTNKEIEESQVEDAQMQSFFSENPVAYNCNSMHHLVTNEKLLLADNHNVNENFHLTNFQRSGAVVGVGSKNANIVQHLDGDWLTTNIAASEEMKKTVEDARVHSFNENPSAYNRNRKHCHDNDKFPLADNHNVNEDKLQLRGDGSSGDASMSYDGQCDVPGNFEQQGSMTTYSIANEMLCEDESSVLNHDHMLDQSDFSEVSANFISNTQGSIDGGDVKPSSHLEDIQVQSYTENPVSYNRSSKQGVVVTVDKFTLADDNNIHEDSRLSDFQRPGAVAGIDSPNVDDILTASSEGIKKTNLSEGALDGYDIHASEHNASNLIRAMPESEDGNVDVDEREELSQMDDAKKGSSDILPLVELKDSRNVDDILHLDGDCLPTNIASSEEIKKKNSSEGALEGYDIHSSEHNAFNHHIPENEHRNLDVDDTAELSRMDDVKKGSSDILPLGEIQLNDNVVSSECNSSIEMSKHSFTDVVTCKSEEHYSLNESSNLPALDNPTFETRTPQVREVGLMNSITFSDEAETHIFEKDEFSSTQHLSKANIYSVEDSSKLIHLQESATINKQEVPTVKPPSNAAPFSEEWLAAIEAAGEEILTMKSGAVQNSPPDKPQHEPGETLEPTLEQLHMLEDVVRSRVLRRYNYSLQQLCLILEILNQ